MATSTIRLAAGVAVAVAITVAGGPTVAVAAATPDIASPSGHSRDGGHQRAPRADPRRQRDSRGTNRPDRVAPDAGGATPRALVVVPAASAPAPQVAPVVPSAPVRTGRGGASPVSAVPASVPPRVVVGNGRAPAPVRLPVVDAEIPPTPSSSVVTAPPPAAPVLGPLVAPTLTTVRAIAAPPFELPAPPPWTTVTPGWPTGALFGIAGLLLAPLAGMWLGHRQARASKSASQLVSR